MSLFVASAFLAGVSGAADLPSDQMAEEAASIPAPTTNPFRIGKTAWRDINFVPRRWKLVDKVEGDLDGDGRTDSVLIVQRNDPQKLIENKDGLGMGFYDANPRAVIVVLQKNQGEYRLSAVSQAIIPDHDQPTISDPYQDIRIEAGSLHLGVAFFANAGSWSMFNHQFQFRWDGDDMALIGFESNYVHRGSGELRQISVNYLTGKRKDAVGSIEDDESDWKWSDVPKGFKPVLGSIGNGFEFEG